MKKFFLIIVCVCVLAVSASAINLGDVIKSELYKTKGFVADMEQIISVPAQNMKMNIQAKMYMKDEWVRVEMTYTPESFNNPAQYQQMKMMKMDKMVVIQGVKDGKDYTVMAYPELKGYVEMIDQNTGSQDFRDMNKMMDTPAVKVGSEEFAGVKADKYEITPEEGVAPSENDKYYVYVDPSSKLMVGMYVKGEGSEVIIKYKNIKLGVDDSVFAPPKGMKKYDNMQQLSMAGMSGF